MQYGLDGWTIYLAQAVLSLADDAGMPDSHWQTDERITFARSLLEIGPEDRYTRSSEWDMSQYDGERNTT
jgi:hypothetical protein